ncbi:DUF5050 domain-containing protein [Cytobacillus dafuensis]|nr:DUF5050 domain-containing protein [Cytobacillus dafuensis]
MKFMRKFGLLFLVSLIILSVNGNGINAKAMETDSRVSEKGLMMASANAKAYDETYKNLLKAITSFQDTAYFPPNRISYKEISPIINQVLADHPEIFYFKHEGTRLYSNGKIELKYKYPTKTIKEMVKKQEAKAAEIIKQTIKPGYSDFDKVKAIHDYIVLNTAYDHDNFQKGKVPEASFTAYGVLINGVAVCEGYADTMKLLLEKAGVETHKVSGKGNGGPHAWNLVKVDGEYFYIDTTWDDPVPNREGQVSYKYFLVPASYLKKDHSWDEKPYPAAKSNRYAYFQEFYSAQEIGNYYYYSNSFDDHRLYRIGTDGKGKMKILDARAPYFVVAKDSIYFSNYSNNGYLFRAKLNGSGLQQINKVHSIDLYLVEDKLFYTNKSSGTKTKIGI